MITLKSEREIELMRVAGHIAELAQEAVEKAIKPGVSTEELNQIAYDTITAYGATPSCLNYEGFPASICASINEVIIHGIPNKHTILKNGDIITIDLVTNYKGYNGDCARTHFCGDVKPEVKQLVEVTRKAFEAGMNMARPGNRLSDISHAVEEYIRPYGYGIIEEYTGHGIGTDMHEDPSVPNYGPAGHGPILKKGMTIAIEPMVTLGKRYIKVLKDGWTTVTRDGLPAAHHENTILITDKDPEILTRLHDDPKVLAKIIKKGEN